MPGTSQGPFLAGWVHGHPLCHPGQDKVSQAPGTQEEAVSMKLPRSVSHSAGCVVTPGRNWAWAAPNAAFLGLDYGPRWATKCCPSTALGRLGPSDPAESPAYSGVTGALRSLQGQVRRQPTSVCPLPSTAGGPFDAPGTCLAVPGTGLGPCNSRTAQAPLLPEC